MNETRNGARMLFGKLMGRHHREMLLNGDHCAACHNFSPTVDEVRAAIEQEAARPLPEPQPDERVSVRIKVYGGGRSLLAPGTDWRVERTTEHVAPSGLIGEVMPEWTLIDLQPLGALPDRPEPDERANILTQTVVSNALDEAWLESHDARDVARPPDLAGHLHDALHDYIAIVVSEMSEADRPEPSLTEEQIERWLTDNDLFLVTHVHESEDCVECRVGRVSPLPEESRRSTDG